MKDCCVYHANHEYAGVVVEIMHDELKEMLGGNYLIQVWSNQGILHFEQVLIKEPIAMNIFKDAFLFVRSPESGEKLQLTVVNLTSKGSYFDIDGLIKD